MQMCTERELWWSPRFGSICWQTFNHASKVSLYASSMLFTINILLNRILFLPFILYYFIFMLLLNVFPGCIGYQLFKRWLQKLGWLPNHFFLSFYRNFAQIFRFMQWLYLICKEMPLDFSWKMFLYVVSYYCIFLC